MTTAAVPAIVRDGTILINDGAGSPLGYTIVYEDGDFSVDELIAGQMEVQPFKDRGIIYALRKTEDKEISFSFSGHLIALLGDGTTAMPFDVALKLGVWAAATTLLPTGKGDVHLVKVTLTLERTDFSATADSTIVLKYCHLRIGMSEGIPGKWTIKGTCYPFSTDSITLTG